MRRTSVNFLVKRITPLIMAVLCVISATSSVLASDIEEITSIPQIVSSYQETYSDKDVEEIELAYRTITDTLYDMGYFFDVSLELFIEKSADLDIAEYCQEYLENYLFYSISLDEPSIVSSDISDLAAQELNATTSGGDDEWFYNTGTTLPQIPSYDTYSLINKLRAGDIVIEHNTVVSGITGHAAIVEGLFYNSEYKTYYIRLVEAIKKGVCRSIMDDERVDKKDAHFYRLTPERTDIAQSAASFAKTQLGKGYYLLVGSSVNPNKTHWYCSELVYASYYNQGTNPIPGVLPGDAIWPYDFEDSSVLREINIT